MQFEVMLSYLNSMDFRVNFQVMVRSGTDLWISHDAGTLCNNKSKQVFTNFFHCTVKEQLPNQCIVVSGLQGKIVTSKLEPQFTQNINV